MNKHDEKTLCNHCGYLNNGKNIFGKICFNCSKVIEPELDFRNKIKDNNKLEILEYLRFKINSKGE